MKDPFTGDDPDSVGFDAVPFALEWLRAPAEWDAEPARLRVSAPAQTDWFIDPISARPVRTEPVLAGPPPTGDFTWQAQVVLDGDAMFDAAGLFVYDDDDHSRSEAPGCDWRVSARRSPFTHPTAVGVGSSSGSSDRRARRHASASSARPQRAPGAPELRCPLSQRYSRR